MAIQNKRETYIQYSEDKVHTHSQNDIILLLFKRMYIICLRSPYI